MLQNIYTFFFRSVIFEFLFWWTNINYKNLQALFLQNYVNIFFTEQNYVKI